ncbi:unnamed protein product [Protopolystoma xenopodis]|uniref:Uncharacterized protein n=1 Tax=Protopolystoma xenopodis TaxID=117903 RepID=A0A448X7F5_9PLAT|nr:unnamed protein product [Protopolystoma xenopodis]
MFTVFSVSVALVRSPPSPVASLLSRLDPGAIGQQIAALSPFFLQPNSTRSGSRSFSSDSHSSTFASKCANGTTGLASINGHGGGSATAERASQNGSTMAPDHSIRKPNDVGGMSGLVDFVQRITHCTPLAVNGADHSLASKNANLSLSAIVSPSSDPEPNSVSTATTPVTSTNNKSEIDLDVSKANKRKADCTMLAATVLRARALLQSESACQALGRTSLQLHLIDHETGQTLGEEAYLDAKTGDSQALHGLYFARRKDCLKLPIALPIMFS